MCIVIARPEHRALPDARAAADLLTHLLALAAEQGARTVGDVLALSRARPPRKERVRAAPATEHRSREGQRAA